MKLDQKVIRELRVKPGQKARLMSRSTTGIKAGGPGDDASGDSATEELEEFKQALEAAQDRLYASGTWALLLIFQALDAAGKDGTIKHVMSGVNPQGCRVTSFKQPSTEELGHDFLWRCAKALPERGLIGIFNRSYYEEVLVTRVHPELLRAQRLPVDSADDPNFWTDRYDDINRFEQHLSRSGTRIVKFFLHVSKDEQRRRFLARIDDPAKRWKFSSVDVAERAHFDRYQAAYEDAITATSTPWAPWHVIPADHKPTMRALVGGIVVDAITALKPAYPELDPSRMQELEEARQSLLAEADV